MKNFFYKLLFLLLVFDPSPMLAADLAHLYQPSGRGPFPALIVLHSRGGLRQHVLDYASTLTRKGYVALAVDYLAGPSRKQYRGRDLTVVNEELEPIISAYDRLKGLPVVDPKRIGVVGFSLGGNRALIFAATQPGSEIKAIVSYYVGCWGCGQTYRPGRFPPLLFLHGELDEETHPDKIKDYCNIQRSSGNICELYIYRGVHHAFDTNSPNYPASVDPAATADAFERTIAFLDEHVKGKSK